MISTEIKINGKVIHSLSAVNIGKARDKEKGEWRWYRLGCGHKLKHDRNKGALCMLVQMAGHSMMCKRNTP